MASGIRCMWMRGGTSRGGYFLAEDLPADTDERDAFLLSGQWARRRAPDRRHGWRRPLTSKVGVVRKSDRNRHRCRLPLPAGLRRPAACHRQAELRQHPRRHRPSPSSGGWSSQAARRRMSGFFHGKYRARLPSPRSRPPGGRVSYEGNGARYRRRAGHRRTRSCSHSRTRPVILRRGAADRQRRRRDRRCVVTLIDNGMPLRGHEGRRYGYFWRGEPGRTGSQRGTARGGSSRPSVSRPAR